MLRDRDLVPNPRKRRSIRKVILMAVLGLFTAFLLRLLLNAVWFFPIVVSNNQMEPGLKSGDKVYVNRRVGLEDIKKGDVLLVRHPAAEGLYQFRRVAGTAGDKVALRNGVVYVNDQALSTPAEFEIRKGRTGPAQLPASIHPRDNTPPSQVPPKSFYLLADNRGPALDSRMLGAFHGDLIVGRIMNW